MQANDGGNAQLKRIYMASCAVEKISNLASLMVDVRQGDPFHATPVRVTVSCGNPCIKVFDYILKLSTTQVVLRLTLENARIKPNSIRHVNVQDGHWIESSNILTQENALFERNVGAETNASTEINGITKFIGSFFGKIGKSKKENSTIEVKREKRREVQIIFAKGCGVAIGDDQEGDPSRPGGILSGEYPRTKQELDPPLFVLEPKNPDQSMLVTVAAAVSIGKLSVEIVRGPETKDSDHLIKEAHGNVIKLSKNSQREHAKNTKEALRERMISDEIGILAQKKQEKYLTGLGLGADEFAVYMETFGIENAKLQSTVNE